MTATLSELFNKYGSDKNSFNKYGPAYDALLAGRRESVRDVLEVGVYQGRSLLAWAEFFPSANVVGLDIHSGSLCRGERIETFLCNAADEAQVGSVLKDRKFDLIVDDGSHRLSDQAAALAVLWPRLRAGGVFVVEDIQGPVDQAAAYFGFVANGRFVDCTAEAGHLGATLLIIEKPATP